MGKSHLFRIPEFFPTTQRLDKDLTNTSNLIIHVVLEFIHEYASNMKR